MTLKARVQNGRFVIDVRSSLKELRSLSSSIRVTGSIRKTGPSSIEHWLLRRKVSRKAVS